MPPLMPSFIPVSLCWLVKPASVFPAITYRVKVSRILNYSGHKASPLALCPWVNRDIKEDDNVEAFAGKIFESPMAGLDCVRSRLDSGAINHAVDLLTAAKKIASFGLGASATVAQDAMNKFFRFHVPVISSDDIVMQRMYCINSAQGDVVALISCTGRTKNLVELAQLARENNATVLAITSPDSLLAREATLTLNVDVATDTDVCMPMVSRLAQLTLTDVLATGFILRRDARFRDNLMRVKSALRGHDLIRKICRCDQSGLSY